MRNFLFLVFCFLFLVSCQSNSNKIPVVGSLDTLMQKGFESSYEFHKTLTVHEKLVYDVVGFGGSSSAGEYAILRRGADNKTDTVTKGVRNGIIAETFLADSNKNSKEEVYVVIQNPSNPSETKTVKYEAK